MEQAVAAVKGRFRSPVGTVAQALAALTATELEVVGTLTRVPVRSLEAIRKAVLGE